MANTAAPRKTITINATRQITRWARKTTTTVTPPAADTTAPVVTAFVIPSTADALTIAITTFTATDNIAVTGYLITETSTPPLPAASGWTPAAPSSYTFTTEGAKTLYAWAKDAAGNVSAAVSDSVTITLPVADEQFIKSFAVAVGGGTLSPAQITKLAKFNVAILQRFNYDDSGGWGAIRAINPDIKIFAYQMGSQTSNIQDAYAQLYMNTIGRWNNARGHSQGNLNTNNPSFFLLDASGNRIYAIYYPDNFLFDIGNPSMQQYWIEATRTDMVGKAYTADGIFMDGCFPISVSGLSGSPVKYATNAAYTAAVNSFLTAVAAGFAGEQLICANYGETRYADGATAWGLINQSATPPQYLFEEGCFVTAWWTNVDSAFNQKSEWVRQINVLRDTTNINSLFFSHTKLNAGQTGVDNYGKAVTYWETLWYALASFALGKTEKSFFSFCNYTIAMQFDYFDEYDLIDLGAAVGNYQVRTVGGQEIYWREFAGGYVYVNPNAADVSGITLPVSCRQITHDNMANYSGATPVSSFNLVSHRGAFFAKA